LPPRAAGNLDLKVLYGRMWGGTATQSQPQA
jgi:hypothetical protein